MQIKLMKLNNGNELRTEVQGDLVMHNEIMLCDDA